MPTGLSYNDYLSFGRRNLTQQEGEGGPMIFRPMSEAEWNAMSPEQRYQTLSSGGYLANSAWGQGGGQLDSESDMARRYAQAFGRQTPTDVYYAQARPEQGIARPELVWQDPESGMWVVPQDAIDPNWRNQLEAADNTGIFTGEPWQNILTGASVVLGGAGLDSLLTGGVNAGVTGGVNAGLDAFEAGSFAAGGAPETGMALGYQGATAATPFDSFLDNYLSGPDAAREAGIMGPEYHPEADWWTGDPTGNTGPLGGSAPVSVDVLPGYAGPGSSIWDRLSSLGSGLVDKLPAIANAASMFGKPDMPTQARASGGGSSGGGFSSGGGGFGRGDGSAFDPMKLKQVLTLAEYLGGRK